MLRHGAETVTPAGRGEMQVWMQGALHDLCQPLTALQCRLALATLVQKNGREEEVQELRATVVESLVECERLIGHVRRMQTGMSDAEGEE